MPDGLRAHVIAAFAANRGDDGLLPGRLRGQFNVPSLDARLKRVGAKGSLPRNLTEVYVTLVRACIR
jgi:hypothetical protein